MSGIKPEIMSFIAQLSPRQQQYVLAQLTAGKDAYITLHIFGKCQRCGEEYKKIQAKITLNNIYFYHRKITGSRCYMGPENYIYVSILNKIVSPLHGAVVQKRILKYIERVEKYIRMITDIKEIEEIENILKDLESLIEFRKNQLKK